MRLWVFKCPLAGVLLYKGAKIVNSIAKCKIRALKGWRVERLEKLKGWKG